MFGYMKINSRKMKIYMTKLASYVGRVSTHVSILINVVLGGASNQTFSARNYEWKRLGKPNLCFVIDNIFYWQPNHCMMGWIYWTTLTNVKISD